MSLVFTRAAAARILGCSPEEISRFEVWANCIFIHVKQHRPTFVSKTKFYQEFSRYRQAGAMNCQVRAYSSGTYAGSYDVTSGVDKRWHSVRLRPHWQSCSCEDYKSQTKHNLPKPCCKHLYAALGQLGYRDLESYIRLNQLPVKPPVQVGSVNLPRKYRHVGVV